MDEENIVATVADEVKLRLQNEESSHDWWHILRVWKLAQRIGAQEGADMLVVNLAALLHDIADWKFNDGDDSVGPRIAQEILDKHRVSKEVASKVAAIIKEASFKGAGVKSEPFSLEGKVVQDADRLDAIGAIGIGRTFAYGGHKGRRMYDPNVKPVHHASKEEYIKNTSPTLNHFYEKLFLLKDLMNTETAKKLAADRHQFMEEFVERFLKEWDGER